MPLKVLCLLGILLPLAGAGLQPDTPAFVDPAPPTVQKLADITPPEPQAQEGLKFHAAPRPLAAGAVTHDWRSFLGPTHNAISTEMPLLKTLGSGGPTLV